MKKEKLVIEKIGLIPDWFNNELKELLNKHWIDNKMNVTDFLLSDMLCSFLEVVYIQERENKKFLNFNK